VEEERDEVDDKGGRPLVFLLRNVA